VLLLGELIALVVQEWIPAFAGMTKKRKRGADGRHV
jgi:hypothetical protein